MRMRTKLKYGEGDKTRHRRPKLQEACKTPWQMVLNKLSLADIHRDQTRRAAPCGAAAAAKEEEMRVWQIAEKCWTVASDGGRAEGREAKAGA